MSNFKAICALLSVNIFPCSFFSGNSKKGLYVKESKSVEIFICSLKPVNV